MPDGLGDANLQVLEINVIPLQGEKFTNPKPRRHVEQNQGPIPHSELRQKSLKFMQFEDIGNPLSLRALAHELDRILIRPLVPHRVMEESAHKVPNLCFRSPRSLDTT